MTYLLNDSYLPWSDVERRFVEGEMEFREILKERLNIEYTKKFFKMLPSINKYLLNLTLEDLYLLMRSVLIYTFDEKPDYDYIID